MCIELLLLSGSDLTWVQKTTNCNTNLLNLFVFYLPSFVVA